MSEADIIGTKSTRISSDEIIQRAFPSKVRGISESEVRSFLKRIAEDFQNLETREEQLLEQIRQLEHNLENRPKVTKHELLEGLGEETARILTNAEEASEKMMNEAKESSEKMISEAKEKAESIVDTAQSESDSQMKNVHSRVRALHQSAERDVETLVEEARTSGREIFQDAVIVREKILKDLLRRRDLLLEQIDELRKGREELLESYKIVKGSFQKATDSLHAVEEKASSELMAQQIDVDELLKAPVELPQTLETDHKLPSQEIDLTDDSIDLDESKTNSDNKESNEASKNERELASVAAPSIDSASTVQPGEKKKGIKGYMKDALGVSDESKPQVIDPDEVKNDVGQDSIAITIVDTPQEEEQVDSEKNNEVSDAENKKDVGELFKSLKEQKQPQKQEAKRDKPKEKTKVESKETAEKPKKQKAKPTSAVQKRNHSIESVQAAILKKAKKHLQDEQNELLDNIRTVKAKKTIEANQVLPDENTQMKAWQEAISDELEIIFQSGAKSVSNKKAKYSQDAMQAAVNWIVSPLRETLRIAIEDGEHTEVGSRVGARYREWRNSELKNTLFDAMSSAYNNGVLANASKDATLKWEVEKQGRCPDCDDNALEPTTIGENFPTGQISPPAHSGCKCVLVVA